MAEMMKPKPSRKKYKSPKPHHCVIDPPLDAQKEIDNASNVEGAAADPQVKAADNSAHQDDQVAREETSVSLGQEVEEKPIVEVDHAKENAIVLLQDQEHENLKLDVTVDVGLPCAVVNDEPKPIEESAYAYTLNSPYSILVDDLRDCLRDVAAPSAPQIDCSQAIASSREKRVPLAEEELFVEDGPHMKELMEELNVADDIIQPLLPFTENDLAELYQNEELTASIHFLELFSQQHKPVEDELFLLLTEYLTLRKAARESDKRLDMLSTELLQNEKDLWSVWPEVVMTERAKCGDMNDVIVSHRYQNARFNKAVWQRFQSVLAQSKQLATKEQWPNDVRTCLCKVGVEAVLWDILNCCPAFTDDDVSMLDIPNDSFTRECVARLSNAVATLFYFLRKIPVTEDDEFVAQTKTWLTSLAAVLIRVGSWREHLFVLCHVLRCPPSVAMWAAPFVQCPPRAADHAFTLLSVLLQPVARRELFLEDRVEGGPWVLLDDDGEDHETDPGVVTETVLFLLLNQVPLKEMLLQYLLTEQNLMNELTLVKVFAFFSSLVCSLRCGLNTYAGPEHRQFGKRLGKLVRELLEMATDQLDLYTNQAAVSPRIQAEYDAFLLRATRALLSAPPSWQFLAAAPFQRTSAPIRWLLYLDLVFADGSTGDPARFAAHLASLADAEQCHLLSALSNLALAPGCTSKKLVRTVALHIFYVGFVNAETRDSCYKVAKSLMASMVAAHQYLLSELLDVNHSLMQSDDLDEEAGQVELWQTLPVSAWVPSQSDLSTLITWLLAPPSSIQCGMARCILRLLNYEVIPHKEQKKIGWAVVRAGQQGAASGGFVQFSWALLCQLRLHVVDRGDMDKLTSVPHADTDAELGLLIAQNVPAAVFLGLLTTGLGHFVPVIYSQGFKLVRRLLSACCYEAAFVSIDFMATMFWDCPDSLASCQDFLAVLGDVVVLDDSYMKMAKSMIVNDQPGPLLRKFAAMLHAHLERGGIERLPRAVNLWARGLTSLLMWQHNAGALYLLDVVCRRAFSFPGAWLQMLEVLESALPATGPTEARSPLSFLRLGSSPSAPTLLPRGCNGNVPWFAFAAISVEFELYEKRTSLWSELLRELWDRRQKPNVDGAVKKVCSALKLPVRTSAQLAFYRWANQALEMTDTHPLNVLVWEKLLELYVARVPGLVDRGSPGASFFHGVANSGLLRKLKSRLVTLSAAQPNLSATFQTLGFWLSEPRLLEPGLLVAVLPSQFNAPLLAALLTCEGHAWYSLLPLKRMQENLAKDATAWSSMLGRMRKLPLRNVAARSPPPPRERIFKRLEEFGCPSPLPPSSPITAVLPKVTLEVGTNKVVWDFFSLAHGGVQTFLSDYKTRVKELSSCEATVLRAAGQLYCGQSREVRLTERCEGVIRDENVKVKYPCSSPAVVILKYMEWAHNQAAQNTYDSSMVELRRALPVSPVSGHVITSMLLLEHVADAFVLESARRELDGSASAVSVAFFHNLMPLWQEANQLCPAVAVLLERCILKLGQTCIADKPEMASGLLSVMRNFPDALFLNQLVNPGKSSGVVWLDLYRAVLESPLLVHLLPRFDVAKWLGDSQLKSGTVSGMLLFLLNTLKDKQFTPLNNPKVHKLLNTHLQLVTLHKFPEHYGQVLLGLLNGSDDICPGTWYAFINAFAPPGLSLKPDPDALSLTKLAAFLANCAAEQTLLSLTVLHDTAALLGGTMNDYRLNKKASLYARYRPCVEPLLAFVGLTVHCLVWRTLSDRPGLLSAQAVDLVWPPLERAFTPWLVPYGLAGDVLQQPFASDDAALAGFAATVFTETIRFIALSTSGPEAALSRTVMLYTQHLCLEKVDGLVLSTLHSSLATLPWNAYSPTFQDVEAILQVVNKFLPLSHGFLANVFVSVDWSAVVNRSLAAFGSEVNARLHVCLLHLLVKFPSEPSLRLNKAVKQLVEVACSFAWHLVDAGSYGLVVAWFTSTCDPDVVLNDPASDYRELDSRILRLLQVAAGYDTELKYFHPSTSAKRHIFVASVVRCLATVASQRKHKVTTALVHKLTFTMLTDIERVVAATVPELQRVDEAAMLLSEMLRLLSETRLGAMVEGSLVAWLAEGRARLVTAALWRCAGGVVDNPVLFGTIIEASIESHFTYSDVRSWQVIAHSLTPYAAGTVPMAQVLISNGCYLALHALLLQRLRPDLPPAETRNVLTTLLQMLATVKSNDLSEPKLLLLAGMALALTTGQPDAPSLLQTLSDHLVALAADRGAGFLSSIGLKKASSPTIKMKLCCLALTAGISSVLLSEHKHISNERSQLALDRAESNKQFLPVMGDLLTVKKELANVQDTSQLLHLLYSTAKQLYNKLYFGF